MFCNYGVNYHIDYFRITAKKGMGIRIGVRVRERGGKAKGGERREGRSHGGRRREGFFFGCFAEMCL